ncbi:Ulp1 family isopeptidase [Chlamydia vaughanii]|uniref:Ulp1 family isopeptidase n=1 Tax=Chlamydia vaughanii TaxID=3112552 RepID=UPI0032B12899
MASFLLTQTQNPSSLAYDFSQPTPPPSPLQTQQQQTPRKTPITGPGSFDNASFLSKLARVLFASLVIIITLGLILCLMSSQDILDLNSRALCLGPTDYYYYPQGYPGHPYVFPQIAFSSWDNYSIAHFSKGLRERYPTLFSSRTCDVATCFNLEETVLKNLHIDINSDQRIPLPEGETVCPVHDEHGPADAQVPRCDSYRIFSIPIWHHPSAQNAEEMDERLVAVVNANFAGISHWALLIVNLDRRELVYFDSIGSFINPQLINPPLTSTAARLGNHYPSETGSTEPFTIKRIVKEPLQHDGSSCGIWLSLFLEKYLENPDYVPTPMGIFETQTLLQNFLDRVPESPTSL